MTVDSPSSGGNQLSRRRIGFQHLCWLVSVLLVGVTFYRAATMSFTHDESYSYLHYLDDTVGEVLSFTAAPIVPNNHILNSLGMRLTNALFGPSELSLRLPSVLSLIAFLFVSFLITDRYMSGPWRFPAFLLLSLNPYLLEFFCMARGYGMSCTLLIAAVWFFLRAMEEARDEWRAAMSILLATVAVLAHLTLLTPSVILVGMIVAGLLRSVATAPRPRGPAALRLLLPALSLAAGLALLYEPIRQMLASGEAFGPKDGFWQGTVSTLIHDWQNNPVWDESRGNAIIDSILIVSTLVAIAYVGHSLVRRRLDALADPATTVTVLLVASGLGNWVQFHAFGNPYLSHRTGMFYMPLFALSFGLIVQRLLSRLPPVAQWVVAVPIAALLLFHTAYTLRFDYFREWRHEGAVLRVLDLIEDDWRARGMQRPATLGITWTFEPSINFYRQTRQLDWLAPVHRDGFADKPYDYYLVAFADVALVRSAHTVLLDDAATRALLAKSAVDTAPRQGTERR